MSVFRSNTLIFAPEFWECILLRGSDFKILPETRAFAVIFFILHLLQTVAFATHLKSYWKPWVGGKGFT